MTVVARNVKTMGKERGEKLAKNGKQYIAVP
jgi:hypothetical protein